MANHPNRSTANRMKWNWQGDELVATWPATSEDHAGETWTFSRPGGGYVFCDRGNPARSSTLGIQICHGGEMLGSTIEAADEAQFEKVVKSGWQTTGENWRGERAGQAPAFKRGKGRQGRDNPDTRRAGHTGPARQWALSGD